MHHISVYRQFLLTGRGAKVINKDMDANDIAALLWEMDVSQALL
jgi:hypothetical protein